MARHYKEWNEKRQYWLFYMATETRADLMPFFPEALSREQFEALIFRHAQYDMPVIVSTRVISQRERTSVYNMLIKNHRDNKNALVLLHQTLGDEPKRERVRSLETIA